LQVGGWLFCVPHASHHLRADSDQSIAGFAEVTGVRVLRGALRYPIVFGGQVSVKDKGL
jgi:hypothetical protein